LAPPITYALNGQQYLSILVGWGGTTAMFGFNPAGAYKAEGRLWTFVLGGSKPIAPPAGQPRPALSAIAFDDDPALLARGADLYAARCVMCHGNGAASGGAIADLRYASEATFAIFHNIVREGAYAGLGMP